MLPQNHQTTLRHIKNKLAELEQVWPPQINLNSHSNSKTLDYLPYSLLEPFCITPSRQVLSFLAATQLIANATLLLDNLIDVDSTDPAKHISILRLQAIQFEGYMLLTQLYSSRSVFWKQFRARLTQFTTACIREKQFAHAQADWQTFQGEALTIAAGKAALANLIIDGLAELSGQLDLIESLTKSLTHYYVAIQMVDDVQDWLQDIVNNQPSFLLSLALPEWSPEARATICATEDSKMQFRRRLYIENHISTVLAISCKEMVSAQASIDHLPHSTWHQLICDHHNLLTDTVSQTEKIVQQFGRGE